MIAYSEGHLDAVKTLIEAGANVNQTNKVGTCIRTYMHTDIIVSYPDPYFHSSGWITSPLRGKKKKFLVMVM